MWNNNLLFSKTTLSLQSIRAMLAGGDVILVFLVFSAGSDSCMSLKIIYYNDIIYYKTYNIRVEDAGSKAKKPNRRQGVRSFLDNTLFKTLNLLDFEGKTVQNSRFEFKFSKL